MRGSRAAATALLTLISVASARASGGRAREPRRDAARVLCQLSQPASANRRPLARRPRPGGRSRTTARHGRRSSGNFVSAPCPRWARAGRIARPTTAPSSGSKPGSTPPPRSVPIRAARCCTGSTAPSTPTPSAISSDSTSTCHRSCRPTMRRMDSTTWRTRWAVRRRCCRRISRPRARSAPWPSATRASAPAATPTRSGRISSQDQHLDGLPLGTFGGMTARHLFPLDGEYDFQVRLYRIEPQRDEGRAQPPSGRADAGRRARAAR